MDEPKFQYSYGPSFAMIVSSFVSSEITGVLSVYLYILQYKHAYYKTRERAANYRIPTPSSNSGGDGGGGGGGGGETGRSLRTHLTRENSVTSRPEGVVTSRSKAVGWNTSLYETHEQEPVPDYASLPQSHDRYIEGASRYTYSILPPPAVVDCGGALYNAYTSASETMQYMSQYMIERGRETNRTALRYPAGALRYPSESVDNVGQELDSRGERWVAGPMDVDAQVHISRGRSVQSLGGTSADTAAHRRTTVV